MRCEGMEAEERRGQEKLHRHGLMEGTLLNEK